MRYLKLIITTLFLFGLALTASATTYEHGHNALQIFGPQGFRNAPLWVQIWIGFMGLTFAAGLFFVWNHSLARWVVGGLLAGLVLGTLIANVLGIPTLSGFLALIHLVFWSPGLYLLLTKRPFTQQTSAFSIWSGIMTAVILFSFVFDIRDAVTYLRHVL